MKKGIVVVLFFVVFSFLADAHYVRKVREPDFFIPEADRMHKPEVIPKIRYVQENKKEIKTEENKVKMSIPEYKNKYSRYIEDMVVFAKSKVMPENEELKKDLNYMLTGEVFEVTENVPEAITSLQQEEFYRITNKILEN
ncbi:MAG: hypothetical protein E7020_05045 [Alphaproteobacteria bacterium]|nr:hypothetical protein [Alphaproteobacteria bacterium]